MSVIRRLMTALRRPVARRPTTGKADLSVFEDTIERYRKLGTRIGRKVRLLGRIDGVNPHLVSIGDYCVIGAGSALLAHGPIKGGVECKVGNYVYLAYGVIVLPGVEIGDYCIVGAGSVVTRDIAPNSVAAGNPCRVLRSLTDSEREHLVYTMENDLLFGWVERK